MVLNTPLAILQILIHFRLQILNILTLIMSFHFSSFAHLQKFLYRVSSSRLCLLILLIIGWVLFNFFLRFRIFIGIYFHNNFVSSLFLIFIIYIIITNI